MSKGPDFRADIKVVLKTVFCPSKRLNPMVQARPGPLASKCFKIFRVMAQSPVDVFRGFVKKRAFWSPKERLLLQRIGILRKEKVMVVARGWGADEAATRRCRLSELLPETPLTPVRTLRTPRPALRSAVVLILLVSGISSSASNAPSAGVARSAPTALGDPCTWRPCLYIKGGGGSRGRGGAADVPGQVRHPILNPRTCFLCACITSSFLSLQVLEGPWTLS